LSPFGAEISTFLVHTLFLGESLEIQIRPEIHHRFMQ
jgi:hypothetical protein